MIKSILKPAAGNIIPRDIKKSGMQEFSAIAFKPQLLSSSLFAFGGYND